MNFEILKILKKLLYKEKVLVFHLKNLSKVLIISLSISFKKLKICMMLWIRFRIRLLKIIQGREIKPSLKAI